MATRIIKTQVTGTSTQKFTLSAWVKKASNITSNDQVLYESFADGSNRNTVYFRGISGNTLNLYCALGGSTVCEIETTRKFRDVNSWYNIVLKVDTTQGNASHRVRIYVNGVEETALTSSNYPSQNANLPMGTSSYQHAFGFYSGGGSSAFQGSMSHLHFIDGEDRDASYFGSTDANGVWKIKTSVSGVNYGNNGFFILKDGNSLTDQSGKGNNFTLSTGTLTKTEDSPSNVFATFNPLVKNKDYNDGSLAYGNTYFEPDGRGIACSTIGVTSGKYYAEFKAVDAGPLAIGCSLLRGIDALNDGGMSNPIFYDNNPSYAIGYEQGGTVQYNTTSTSYGSGYSDDDIIGIALDMDNKEMYISVNGTFQNSGDPTSGASKTGGVTGTTSYNPFDDGFEIFFFVSDFSAGGAGACLANFGNGYFGTTAVSSAGTNASGNGIFEFDVPTGYTALSTKGLNL